MVISDLRELFDSKRSLAQVQTKDSQHDLPQAAAQMPADTSSVGFVRVSVIIPAFNEEEMIGKCLESLVGACYPLDAFEVIVVDNGSTDRTLEIARSFSTRLRLTILQRPGVNISALRNLGASAARGELLAFLDADCSIPKDWFENAASNLASDSAGVIGGNITIPEDSGWVARTWFQVAYSPKDGEVAYVPSGNMLMKNSAFVQIGGFNETIKTSEDCELCSRARGAGFTVREISALTVVHWRTPQTLKEFYCREAWHGEHVAKVFFQNIRSMTNFRAVAFAAFVLICGLSAIVGGFLAVFYRQYALLGLALCGLAAGSFLCSFRKLRLVHGKAFWSNLTPLALLYLTWGLARARSLVSFRILHPRSSKL
jgi:glycosyltransferase involved in cell wall biosynthesis